MESLKRVHITGTAVPIPGDDIDTDRIIPARFLKEITFERMGEFLFYDVRFDASDNIIEDYPLNLPEYQNPTFLIVGQNFGCGSSREHAPQAIMRFGIQAVIGESFAEIFAGNCKAIGVPVVTASAEDIATLSDYVAKNPDQPLDLNLESRTVSAGDKVIQVNIADERLSAFISGTWDASALLKANLDQIKQVSERLPYVQNFA